MHAVRLKHLTKDFSVGFWRPHPQRALDDVTLDVPQGEVLGYLGPNGAGKTTTLKLLMQLIYPTAGEAEILGRPPGDVGVRHRLGFLPETPYFYDNLTAVELLVYFATLFGISTADARRRAGDLLDRVGIGAERRLQLRKYSKGMLQRVGIAQALINDPAVVFLDEPMSGLDPIGRRDVRQLVLSLRDEGRTVFFSSHILSDAEAMCSRVAIMVKGRLVASGRLADLDLKVRGWDLVVRRMPQNLATALLTRVDNVTPLADGRCLVALPASCDPGPLIAELTAHGTQILALTPQHETLEEFFVSRVQREQDDAARASA